MLHFEREDMKKHLSSMRSWAVRGPLRASHPPPRGPSHSDVLYLFFLFKFHFLSFLLSDSLSQLLKLGVVTHSTLPPQYLVCSVACNGTQLMLPDWRKGSTSSFSTITSNTVYCGQNTEYWYYITEIPKVLYFEVIKIW